DVALRRVVARRLLPMHCCHVIKAMAKMSAGPARKLGPMASVRPWPKIAEEDQWLIELMEERFEKTSQSPEQLRARAEELRQEADQTDIPAYRDAALALADRYDLAATARLTSR